jgi:hypothetical protein
MVHERERKMLITVGNETAEAEMLWDDAPNICQKIWGNLPIQARGSHSKVCSHELIAMLPFAIDGENFQQARAGTIGWFDQRFTVNLWYGDPGPNGPLGPTAAFAFITKNLDGIGREIKKSWIKPGIKVLFEKSKK